jgi:hypothetical protein
MVYASFMVLEKSCIQLAAKLDKKLAAFEKLGFAHSFLWICRCLSTSVLFWVAAGAVEGADPVLQRV